MKFLFVATLVALVVGNGAATTAQGHFLYHHKHMTLQQKISYFQRSVKHDQGAIRWFANVKRNLTKNIRTLTESRWEFAQAVKQQLKFHKQALKWHKAQLARHKMKWVALHPPPPPITGHLSLWNCIHYGRHPGVPNDPHEGTSASGTYTGYLQMTNPWEGHSGNWYAMGTGVYAIAEAAYQQHGYSRDWLFHQWPNTAPPCI